MQFAKVGGARVIATASTDEKCEKLKQLGCDVVINHGLEDVVKKVKELTARKGVDLVVDYIGKETWARSIAIVRRGGRIVTCGATSGYDPSEDLRHIFYRQIEVLGCTMGNNKELEDSLRMLFSGKVKAIVWNVIPMRDASEAHRLIEARKVFGKVVLVPN